MSLQEGRFTSSEGPSLKPLQSKTEKVVSVRNHQGVLHVVLTGRRFVFTTTDPGEIGKPEP